MTGQEIGFAIIGTLLLVNLLFTVVTLNSVKHMKKKMYYHHAGMQGNMIHYNYQRHHNQKESSKNAIMEESQISCKNGECATQSDVREMTAEEVAALQAEFKAREEAMDEYFREQRQLMSEMFDSMWRL